MFLVAQHVRAPKNRQEGINSFLYFHRSDWTGAPPEALRSSASGELIRQSIVIPPPGNTVRSYIDIAAPQSASWSEIEEALAAFLAGSDPVEFPLVGVQERCWFHINMETGLAVQWSEELVSLVEAARLLHGSTGP